MQTLLKLFLWTLIICKLSKSYPQGFGRNIIWDNFENGAGDLFIFDYAESMGRSSTTTKRMMRRTTTVAIPGMGTTRTLCEDNCLTTNQYNPVCGVDNVTYFNRARLQCARKCGKNVAIKNMGACTIRPVG